ncbi:hypothetical protein PQR70_42375 [Paraburkholderia madseniana]|uniref:hypothetical protein n=1 Tax=Paraburkholderia madseniana TaxID=2599607 RepID=UPI0038BA33DE
MPRLNRDTRFDGQHFRIDDYPLRRGNAAARILSHRPRRAHRVKRVAKERLDLRRPFQHLSQPLLRNNSWVVVVPIIPSPVLPQPIYQSFAFLKDRDPDFDRNPNHLNIRIIRIARPMWVVQTS